MAKQFQQSSLHHLAAQNARYAQAIRTRPARAFSSSAYPGRPSQNEDVVGGMLNLCVNTTVRISEAVVSRTADFVQSIAPPDAPREKIEISVKGTLFLVLLGLLKGVLSFILLVGGVGLALYTATQVFGWNAVLLGQNAGSNWQPFQQQQQWQQQDKRRQPAAGGPAGSNRQQPYRNTSQAGWHQQQQQPQQPQQQQQARHQQNGDVVDVFYGQQGS